MPLSGFGGDNTFNKSKIASKKIIKDTQRMGMVNLGKNSSKANVGLKSKTKGAKSPVD